MSIRRIMRATWVAVLAAVPLSIASAQMPNPYGAAITLEQAKKVAAAAIAESAKNNWPMVVAVTDTAGILVYLEKMDGTMTSSVQLATAKARTAALFKRPTKAFQDGVAGGGAGLRILAIEGVVPIEGGLPLLLDGRIVGAIGLSGGSSDQDGQVARAGVAALP